MMKFENPLLLHLLWVVGLLGVVLWQMYQRRLKRLSGFVDESHSGELLKTFHSQFFVWKQILILLAFVFGVLALARPQWGFEWKEIKRQGVDILVVVDTSKSMLTQDVRPNRLERTKLAIKDLIRKLDGDRVGLIAFSGDAFLLCPLTVGYSGYLLSLDDLTVNTVPVGGTNVARAIEESLNIYQDIPNKYKAVVIVTDGDNLQGDPLEWAGKAKKEGVKVYTIGIGTPEGELIQVDGDNGKKEFLKDRAGNYVKSRLNESLLQRIAVATGGAYVRAQGAQFGLDLLYDRDISKLEKRESEAKKKKVYYERFQIPLIVFILCLMVEICLGYRKEYL